MLYIVILGAITLMKPVVSMICVSILIPCERLFVIPNCTSKFKVGESLSANSVVCLEGDTAMNKEDEDRQIRETRSLLQKAGQRNASYETVSYRRFSFSPNIIF